MGTFPPQPDQDVAALRDRPYPDHVRCIRVSSSSVHRVARFVVAGLLTVGLLLSFSVGRGEAKAGLGAASALGTSGYAYAKAATPDSVALVNASANRDAEDGTSTTKVLVIIGVGLLVVGGAAFEGVYVRRRGGH
jgi:hypothetical protein